MSTALRTTQAVVEQVRALVRAGRGALVTFERPDAPWLEVAGPNGMGVADGGLGHAEVPTLRLHRNGDAHPLAVASADGDFAVGLHAIAEFSRPLLGDEHPLLVALLAAVRDAAADRRPRTPQAGTNVRETGAPDAAGFLSCLTLGDLQGAVERSRIVRTAA
jgi:hypothetical protein